MVVLEIKQEKGGGASTPGVSATGSTSLIEPYLSQTTQKADCARSQAKPKETAREYMERKVRELEEKNRRIGDAATKSQAKTADEKRLASKLQTTTTSAAASTSNTKPAASDKFWDGFITEKPPFPLTELIALRPCSFSAHFYAYARRNGRTGMIKTDLIQHILENCTKISLDDTSKVKEKSSRLSCPRATGTQQAAADDFTAADDEITSQTFEQVCDDLKTYIEDMDGGRGTESKVEQTRLCIEALTTVTEKAKELGKESRAQRNTAVAATSSPSPMSLINQKVNKRGPQKGPPIPMIKVKNLTDLKISDLKLHKVKAATKQKGLIQLWQEWKEWKKNTGQHAHEMPYAEAAKAAARYYAFTSAYGKPS